MVGWCGAATVDPEHRGVFLCVTFKRGGKAVFVREKHKRVRRQDYVYGCERHPDAWGNVNMETLYRLSFAFNLQPGTSAL